MRIGVEATDKREQTWNAYPRDFKGKAGGVRKVGSDPPPPNEFFPRHIPNQQTTTDTLCPPPLLAQLTHSAFMAHLPLTTPYTTLQIFTVRGTDGNDEGCRQEW